MYYFFFWRLITVSSLAGAWSFDDAKQEVLRRDRPRSFRAQEEGTGGESAAAGHPGHKPQRQTQVRGERVNQHPPSSKSSSCIKKRCVSPFENIFEKLQKNRTSGVWQWRFEFSEKSSSHLSGKQWKAFNSSIQSWVQRVLASTFREPQKPASNKTHQKIV